MTEVVFDASAILAFLQAEEGRAAVEARLSSGLLGAINLAEVVQRLSDGGAPEAEMRVRVSAMPLKLVPFDAELAWDAGLLRRHTSHLGLSLADRACLALARREELPVMTADRPWAKLDLGVEIVLIR